MNIVRDGIHRARKFFAGTSTAIAPQTVAMPRDDGLSFYQACDLPQIGFVPGLWDHRGTEDVYLARTDFTGLTAIDVGPANGFWSFEMERRGARVIAIELGPNDDWDAVPRAGVLDDGLAKNLKSNVENSLSDFWKCHAAYNSKVELRRGTVYSVPKIIDKTDVALMGNILQHLRDPFLAIERVASVVKWKIIVSESIWVDDDEFLKTARIQLIPRSYVPMVNHSWYQVSPVYVGEVLQILGFVNLKCEYHHQRFNGTSVDPNPRMVPHFTYSGERP